MPGLSHERILLIGDHDRHVHAALSQVLPAAHVTAVSSVFEGMAELSGNSYTTVLASAEPIERRPEAAVRALRDLAGDGRVVLFGHPTLEPLSRKMLQFGIDDYIVTPTTPGEVQQMFGTPRLRITPAEPKTPEPGLEPAALTEQLSNLPLAEILLDAQLKQPQDALGAALWQINHLIGPSMRLVYAAPGQSPPAAEEGFALVSHALRTDGAGASGASPASLHLLLPRDEDEARARHALSQVGLLLCKLLHLQDRHRKMLNLAFKDELTGIYNSRFFKQFLRDKCAEARVKRFPVTLLLFDIDNFKQYNDRYGHVIGDEILKQTAMLMRRCCREHDVVARVSGDEFAVVFWGEEGPRQPYEPRPASASRLPQTPRQVFERCRRLLAGPEFTALGETGQGTLTISGGLAVFPYEANNPNELIDLADRRLMFGAKKCGKDALFLVGGTDSITLPPPPGLP